MAVRESQCSLGFSESDLVFSGLPGLCSLCLLAADVCGLSVSVLLAWLMSLSPPEPANIQKTLRCWEHRKGRVSLIINLDLKSLLIAVSTEQRAEHYRNAYTSCFGVQFLSTVDRALLLATVDVIIIPILFTLIAFLK